MYLMLVLTLTLTVGIGILLILTRDTLRPVLGLAMLGAAVNLVVFLAGRPGSQAPPVIEAGALTLASGAANPLTQALALTAIVIGFALTTLGLVLVARLARLDPREEADDLRAGEPEPSDPVTPPVMEP